MKSNTNYGIVISCEHASNRIPKEYADHYATAKIKDQLNSHLGFDAGSLHLAKQLGRRLKRIPILGRVSRLLIDLNRSESNRSLFSTISKTKLSLAQKHSLIETLHRPYRGGIKTEIESELTKYQQVIHISVHSFTPIFNSVERKVDVGFLYDPKQKQERKLSSQIIATIKNHPKYKRRKLRIGRNSPYKGVSDGCTTAMRKIFPGQSYIGIEIEVNQKYLQHNHFSRDIVDLIIDSIASQF